VETAAERRLLAEICRCQAAGTDLPAPVAAGAAPDEPPSSRRGSLSSTGSSSSSGDGGFEDVQEGAEERAWEAARADAFDVLRQALPSAGGASGVCCCYWHCIYAT
jgi:hypothetical protein